MSRAELFELFNIWIASLFSIATEGIDVGMMVLT
jgi:hypothetical protein